MQKQNDYKEILKEMCKDYENPDQIRDIRCILMLVCMQELTAFCEEKGDKSFRGFRVAAIANDIASTALKFFGDAKDRAEEMNDYVLWFLRQAFEKMYAEKQKKKFSVSDNPLALFPILEKELTSKGSEKEAELYLEKIRAVRREMRV